ncbi:dimethylsulfoniopropionate lyase [Ancylobacter sp. 6x-1]|uniref:Dimethylsulfoniopropionate lyase n=1 Tax=Ancylobacter crimeensis TaxID=2579147 RepID=A0ABT0DBD9_9HYPH|nr:dimethylsulfonioproprionate lyase family protein [Ancylobacter crimeensis]MCK0197214.1 dimethylsulfoniopropionate lyase [Ancylobacter crimeensis]
MSASPIRDAALQAFLDAARAAYEHQLRDPEGRRSVGEIFAALEQPAATRSTPGERLPVCIHLDAALAAADPAFAGLVAGFRAIEPGLVWRRRAGNATASANFPDGHANAMIVGPGGLEERGDVWLGVSLLGPQVRYPDHDHPPEETYLVLSEGTFRQDKAGVEGDWFTPGMGGTFYNVPGIRHAMRAGAAPLFALWALKPAA